MAPELSRVIALLRAPHPPGTATVVPPVPALVTCDRAYCVMKSAILHCDEVTVPVAHIYWRQLYRVLGSQHNKDYDSHAATARFARVPTSTALGAWSLSNLGLYSADTPSSRIGVPLDLTTHSCIRLPQRPVSTSLEGNCGPELRSLLPVGGVAECSNFQVPELCHGHRPPQVRDFASRAHVEIVCFGIQSHRSRGAPS